MPQGYGPREPATRGNRNSRPPQNSRRSREAREPREAYGAHDAFDARDAFDAGDARDTYNAQGGQNAQNRPNRRPQGAAQARPRDAAHPDDARRPRRQQPAPEPEQVSGDYSTTVKGIIAVFMTTIIVVIIIMLFAKSLFVSSEELAKNLKTGHLTETEYAAIEAQESFDEEVVTTEKKEKKKKTTTEEEEKDKPAELPEGLDTAVAGTYLVNDAVYLHPTPDSASANLATLPYGTEIEVFGSANYGWYYVEYEGQYGYAWGTYFTPKT